jgi:hypothetical protein
MENLLKVTIPFRIRPHYTNKDLKKFVRHFVKAIPDSLMINLKLAVP